MAENVIKHKRVRPQPATLKEVISDPELRRSIEKRLWSRVIKMPETGCWHWRGAKNASGHGKISSGPSRNMLYSHRVAYALTKGAFDDKLVVRHRCDNPICVNPKHLQVGTHQDNSQDAVARGRLMRGNSHTNAKLNDKVVLAIRGSNENVRILARRYGVSVGLIKSIHARRHWTHLPAKKGDFTPKSRLTIEQVLNIRASNKSAAELSREYNTDLSNIHLIRKRKTWSNVPVRNDDVTLI